MHIKWESRKGQGSEIVYYRPGYNVKTKVFLKCKLHVGRKEEGGRRKEGRREGGYSSFSVYTLLDLRKENKEGRL